MLSNNKCLELCLSWAHICTYLFLPCFCLFLFIFFPLFLSLSALLLKEEPVHLSSCMTEVVSVHSIHEYSAPLPLWSCLWLRRGRACCQNQWLTQQLLGMSCWHQCSHNNSTQSSFIAGTGFVVDLHSAPLICFLFTLFLFSLVCVLDPSSFNPNYFVFFPSLSYVPRHDMYVKFVPY